MAPAATLDALLDDLGGATADAEYTAKMIHKIPASPVVLRRPYIVGKCKGKVVLNIGSASGPLHSEIGKAAKKLYGMDKEPTGQPLCMPFDLETCHDTPIPKLQDVEVVVMGEVVEHLSNPGHALRAIREAYPVPLLVTAPNAFADGSRGWLAKDTECVNRDHVAYYSYWTLRRLLERFGYIVKEVGWYNGKPKVAEGLVMWAVPDNSPDGG
jgi:hypothetical protein